MAERDRPHEERLLSISALVSAGYDDHAVTLRRVADTELSANAPAAWFLLRGAAQAFCRAGDNHPLRRLLLARLVDAVAVARMEDMPPRKPTYTGGARPVFERDA